MVSSVPIISWQLLRIAWYVHNQDYCNLSCTLSTTIHMNLWLLTFCLRQRSYLCLLQWSYLQQNLFLQLSRQARRMEIWLDLQNVSVVSDLQNISPPGSDVNMEQKCTITLGKRRNWNPWALLVFCIFYPQSFRHGALEIWSYLWNKKIGQDRDLDNTQLLFLRLASPHKASFRWSQLMLLEHPIAKCICPSSRMYLSKLPNVFVQSVFA